MLWLKIPTSRKEANQLAIYKGGQGFELGTRTTEEQIQLVVRAGLELGGPPYYKSSTLTTRASCLCILGLSHYKSCVSEVLTHLSPIIQVRDGLMS